jgi:L-fuculose-phosphate aldolase
MPYCSTVTIMSPIDKVLVHDIVREAILRCLPKGAPLLPEPTAEAIYNSPEAAHIKDEIIRVGRKLWERQYVDGNGGNISCRIGREYAICTPTLCSKGDLAPEDFSLIDMENVRVCGERPHTSEVLLHLEIYNAVPKARAVIHCHPPHATAYAITGLVPPGPVIPEQEVFIGPVAITPYETPGTKKFAETVLPFVRRHNTILLGNHGIVCWADTVTHAEWLVEIVDTYCRTIILASSLGVPITPISQDKVADLLDIKKKLGMPDCRFDEEESAAGELAVTASEFGGDDKKVASGNGSKGGISSDDVERLVASVTAQVLELLSRKE